MNMYFYLICFLLTIGHQIQAADVATCAKKGGREINGKCYCVRTLPDDIQELESGKSCPALWGLELTFTNKVIINEWVRGYTGEKAPEATKATILWANTIKKLCQGRKELGSPYRCRVEELTLKGNQVFRVIYDKDGFYFQINTDAGVVEVQVRPTSHQEWQEYKDRVDNDIFGMAKSLDLTPHEYEGAGHMHLDVASHFQGDSQLFLDFLIDYQNHPYLALGALGKNYVNNPPLALLSQEQREAFEKETACSGKDIQSLSKSLQERVFYQTVANGLFPQEKFQAMSLNHLEDLGTIEIRALRPEQSWSHVDMLMNLFNSRIKYLRANSRQVYHNKAVSFSIPFRPNVATASAQIGKALEDVVEKQKCVDEFYTYVTQSELPWFIYRAILYPQLRWLTPTELK